MDRDIIRQTINIIAAVMTVIISSFSDRIFGNSVGSVSHQYPVPITPADYAFAIWSIIYLGIIAFAIFQALPAQRTNPRLRRIGYWFAVSCVANIVWQVVWLHIQITLSILPMLLLLGSLLLVYTGARINRTKVSAAEFWCVNVPFGIYLGWVTVATIVNIAVVLRNLGWNGWGINSLIWTVFLLIIGASIAVCVGLGRLDVAYEATIVWAFAGILVKNAQIPLIVIVAALMIALLLVTLFVTVLRYREQFHAWSRALSDYPLDVY